VVAVHGVDRLLGHAEPAVGRAEREVLEQRRQLAEEPVCIRPHRPLEPLDRDARVLRNYLPAVPHAAARDM
jgi:hypothetical protein